MKANRKQSGWSLTSKLRCALLAIGLSPVMCLWTVFLWCSDEPMLTILPWLVSIIGISGVMAWVTAKQVAQPIEQAAESVHLLAHSLVVSASKATKEIAELKALLSIPAACGKTDTHHPWN